MSTVDASQSSSYTKVRDLKLLPKAHLHIHLEGAMRPETLDDLCERYRIDRPEDTQGVRFDNFSGFVNMYWAACECIRTRDDLARLILEVAEDAATHGAWWIEPAFDAERFSTLRVDSPYQLFETQEEGWWFALDAAERAGRATGVGIGFISAVDRVTPVEYGLQRAKVTAGIVKSQRHIIQGYMPCFNESHAGIVAFGLHGNEEGYPPEPFEEVFRVALEDTGLLSVPHAGEIAPFPGGGPASVLGAVNSLRANRIQHGVLAIEDLDLVKRLAQEKICLDVCPSSNLLLNVFPSLETHPLPQLLEIGVPCNLGSDDPLLFGSSLLDEFVLCRMRMGLVDEQLASLARTSFQYSGAPQAVKAAGIAAIDQWLVD